MSGPFHPNFDDLPRTAPIFPLTGALLLPGGQLPLNIFEPRYLNMTRDALGGDRMIGMIQPTEKEELTEDDRPPVYPVGCLGRITAFSETDDGRFLITLTGVCRFRVGRELPLMNGYRRVEALFDRYQDDLEPPPDLPVDRKRLTNALRRFLESQDIEADWESIDEASNAYLVTALAMVCPFEPQEKQAILEAPDLPARAETIITLLEMGGLNGLDAPAARH
ncbi:MAG: peptidase S16 [Alphaproteobacteria bacterium]|nr:peptidase S16 [Alphaproteobacteria bacterium]